MKLNYLSRYIFSRICSFPVEITFQLPSPGAPGTITVASRGHVRGEGVVLTGPWGAEPRRPHAHCGLEDTATRQQASLL